MFTIGISAAVNTQDYKADAKIYIELTLHNSGQSRGEVGGSGC